MSEYVRILLLEDDPHMRETLTDVLGDEGYKVEPASSGADAVAKAASASFDLMVTDIRMAGMDGLEALARVKQCLPDVGSLVITAYAGDADPIRALRLGAGDYLRKPFELADFLLCVERIVAHRQQELSRRRREAGLRDLARGALDALAQAQTDNSASRAGRTACELSRELGLGVEAREEVRIATMLVALRGLANVTQLLQNASLPAAVRRIVRAAEPCVPRTRVDGEATDCESAGTRSASELPLEAKIAMVSLMLAKRTDWRAWFDERWPGLMDTRFTQAVEKILAHSNDDATEVQDEDVGVHDRQLVSLGCALEAVGDQQSADRAFETVIQRAEASRELVEAWLGRARLAASAGQFEHVRQHLESARQVAQLLGPSATGYALLESGLLWTRLAHPAAAREPLEQSVQLLDELRILPGPLLARLALVDAESASHDAEIVEAVQVLGRPEFTTDRLGAVQWLFPLLAQLQALRPQVVIERALQRMAREVPGEIARLLERGVMDAPARRAAVAAMISEGKPPLVWVPSLEHDADAEVRGLVQTQAESRANEHPPLLRIHSLGPFEAWVGETRVAESAWVSSKNKYLLAFLAANGGADVAEDVIIEHFWLGDPERGRKSLYNAKTVILRCLQGKEGVLKYIVRQSAMLRLDMRLPCWHDVQELEKLSSEASRLLASAQVPSALDRFRRMAQLYRGPYLDGCCMDWALEYRARLERLISNALTHLMDNALARRHVQETIEYAHRLLDIDPCRQEAHLAIMQAHLLNGQAEQAVRQFEACRRRLHADLEMEPSIALLETYQRARLGLIPGLPV